MLINRPGQHVQGKVPAEGATLSLTIKGSCCSNKKRTIPEPNSLKRIPMKGSEVLEKILSGNKRFLQGERIGICNPVDVDLGTMVEGQSPIAAVLCCSDSRVPPEHVLDKKIGEIFVVRVAGKVPGPAVIGSLEYAVKHLKVPLLLVLGHEGCGAVKAALEGMGSHTGGALGALIKELEPAVLPVLRRNDKVDDVVHEAVYASVWYIIERILDLSPVIAAAVKNEDLLIKGAVYGLSTGEVSLLEQEG